ncbi:MAG: ATP-grasp domain-containing protein [Woeseiaceae bacterium]
MTSRTLRCAFLGMDDPTGWSIDADLAFAPLEELGWHAKWLPWRRAGVSWDDYDAVYIAAPWDYPEDPQAFLRVLEAVDRSRAVLVNDLVLVRWSLAKTYLRDLESRGAAIVPSTWFDRLDDTALDALLRRYARRALIIKPVVSTNATDTFLLEPPVAAGLRHRLLAAFASRACVVQPFIDNIRKEGEYSLFYFGRTYSHAIRKLPRAGDFRVQEEHGAAILPVEADADMRTAGDRILRLVDPEPVYCRCDFVRDGDGRCLLMELELIEPSMYLRMHPQAPRRFAEAFDARVRSRRRPPKAS